MSALWAETIPYKGWTACEASGPTDQGRRLYVPRRMLGAEFQGESRVRAPAEGRPAVAYDHTEIYCNINLDMRFSGEHFREFDKY